MTERDHESIMGIRSSSALVDEACVGPDTLRRTKDAGFDLLEINFNHAVNGLDSQDAAQAEALRRQAEALGLRLTAHAPDDICLTFEDDEAIARCRRILSGLEAYGVQQIVMHVEGGVRPAHGRDDEALAALVGSLTDLASTCEKTGIPLLVETMTPAQESASDRLTASIDNIVAAVDAVGSPWIGICIDTNHLNLSIDLPAAVSRAGHRVRESHVNDNHGEREEHLVPYDGLIDWAELCGAAQAIDFRGPLVMEPSPRAGESRQVMFDRAARAASRLRRQLRLTFKSGYQTSKM